MDKSALFHLEYGLYLLSARDKKDNACIINTVMQVTDNPVQICVAVNHANLTHDMIADTKKFNVSVLSQSAPFSLYSDFGYVSGREKDKFDGRNDVARAENGIYYLTEHANAYLSAKVKNAVSLETHTLFLGEVTEAISISDNPSVTYNYYQKNIKPQKNKLEDTTKKGYICEVCGYIYEGEHLPEDYICPVCKHGVDAFRPL
ncbi:MAG: flavin reductase [Lachnospiraceae bacterium]|jgi:flavin reductase (DIM6/NTAB) family NADH-FMN oxidoreductase RutF|nr:flavin reductase [Lachnospiraceae bacterium]